MRRRRRRIEFNSVQLTMVFKFAVASIGLDYPFHGRAAAEFPFDVQLYGTGEAALLSASVFLVVCFQRRHHLPSPGGKLLLNSDSGSDTRASLGAIPGRLAHVPLIGEDVNRRAASGGGDADSFLSAVPDAANP